MKDLIKSMSPHFLSFQDAHNGMITVYADATIAFPILALYALSNQKQRKPKRLYKKLGTYYEKLSQDYFNTPGVKRGKAKKSKKICKWLTKSFDSEGELWMLSWKKIWPHCGPSGPGPGARSVTPSQNCLCKNLRIPKKANVEGTDAMSAIMPDI